MSPHVLWRFSRKTPMYFLRRNKLIEIDVYREETLEKLTITNYLDKKHLLVMTSLAFLEEALKKTCHYEAQTPELSCYGVSRVVLDFVDRISYLYRWRWHRFGNVKILINAPLGLCSSCTANTMSMIALKKIICDYFVEFDLQITEVWHGSTLFEMFRCTITDLWGLNLIHESLEL